MYLIVDSSNTVGSAIADVNTSIVTLPDGFSKAESDSSSLELINKNTNEDIYINDLGKVNSSYEQFTNKLKSLKASGEIEIIKNSSNITKDKSLYTIYYQNASDENVSNRSISYLYSHNHTFYIKMSGYENINELNKDLNFIVDTLVPDYKKSQD